MEQTQLNILILATEFGKIYPKHRPKYEFLEAIGEFANVVYWTKEGDIRKILKELPFTPDFIFQYDISGYVLAPKITGLDAISIPKGTYVIDDHWNPVERRKYFNSNGIDIIFSATKSAFLKRYSEYADRFVFLPFSINDKVFRDMKLERDIDYLLMGLLSTNSYPFRKEVLRKFKGRKGFTYHPHPGHTTKDENAFINEKYARELNRAKIFLTCGSTHEYPVAKFIEAPACKALLVAKGNRDIYDMGFEDGVHFINCDDRNVLNKAKYYLSFESERNRIVQNAYQLVQKKHTNQVRANELISHIRAHLKKRRQSN